MGPCLVCSGKEGADEAGKKRGAVSEVQMLWSGQAAWLSGTRRAFVTKPDDLCLVPGTRRAEGES